jgi:hypothetical protein
MSDLQILTGLSILISGFVQLRFSITCWHWQQMVYLAWFSNVTHQACLTFLRSYLHQNQRQRSLRLVSMGVIAILLVVALVPTANYSWSQGAHMEYYADYCRTDDEVSLPCPADLALCSFDVAGTADRMNVVTVAISIVFIVVGYVARIVRLHRKLSVDMVGKTRNFITTHAKRPLKFLFEALRAAESPNSFFVLFLFRPLFAVFIVFRMLADLWTSMFFEVSTMSLSNNNWLITDRCYGLLPVSLGVLSVSCKRERCIAAFMPIGRLVR